MKASFLRLAVVFIFSITAQLVSAQAVITEYFNIKEGITFDFNDKKSVKSIYTTGVLDIDWNGGQRVLAISYDPKLTKIDRIMENFGTITGELSICINNKTRQQYSHTR
jgi:hypothetical protein